MPTAARGAGDQTDFEDVAEESDEDAVASHRLFSGSRPPVDGSAVDRRSILDRFSPGSAGKVPSTTPPPIPPRTRRSNPIAAVCKAQRLTASMDSTDSLMVPSDTAVAPPGTVPPLPPAPMSVPSSIDVDCSSSQADLLPTVNLLTQLMAQLAEVQLSRGSSPRIPSIPLSKLADDDDIEAYLTTFERCMHAYKIQADLWVPLLTPQLTGSARLAFTDIAPEQAGDYSTLKTAILHRYSITPETSRRKFRPSKPRPSEGYLEFAMRLRHLGLRWMRTASSREDVVQLVRLVLLEQFTSSVPQDLQIWLRDRKPVTLSDAAQMAQDYQDARNSVQSLSLRPPRDRTATQCHLRQAEGHIARDCPSRSVAGSSTVSSALVPGKPTPPTTVHPTPPPRKPSGPVRCYNCNERGHIALKCPKPPRTAMFAEDTNVAHTHPATTEASLLGESYFCGPPPSCSPSCLSLKQDSTEHPEFTIGGVVNGTPVVAMVVDTACTRTMVHSDLAPTECLTGETMVIRCAHGDEVTYPIAQVVINIGEQTYYV